MGCLGAQSGNLTFLKPRLQSIASSWDCLAQQWRDKRAPAQPFHCVQLTNGHRHIFATWNARNTFLLPLGPLVQGPLQPRNESPTSLCADTLIFWLLHWGQGEPRITLNSERSSGLCRLPARLRPQASWSWALWEEEQSPLSHGGRSQMLTSIPRSSPNLLLIPGSYLAAAEMALRESRCLEPFALVRDHWWGGGVRDTGQTPT